jgi:putative heme-binding domain-containing protein
MRFLPAFIVVVCCATAAPLSAVAAEGAVSTVQLEALKRLQGVDLESNPNLKAAVLKIVAATRGTPQFVELVEGFKIRDQNEGLLDVALKFPADESGVKAMRMVIESGDVSPVRAVLAGGVGSNQVACVQVLGNTRLPAINDWVAPLLTDPHAADAVRREVVQALAKSESGARRLLELAKQDHLDENLKLTAATALSRAEWSDVRDEAGRVLPLPRAGGDEVMPPIPELVKRTGDPASGRKIFFSETTACNRCHQVGGEGTAIGPDLSQIGDKLGKDALFEAILDPNNGIAFGYEAWTVTTRDDEEVYGLIASETADELAVKDLSGIVHRLKKSAISSRQQSKLSLMPVGLQATMTVQQLVDLVEFLSRLRKDGGK